jgi:hypothetical protein
VDEIWRCGQCGKVFWMGPKSYNAIELVGGMLRRARGEEEAGCENFWNDGYASGAKAAAAAVEEALLGQQQQQQQQRGAAAAPA